MHDEPAGSEKSPETEKGPTMDRRPFVKPRLTIQRSSAGHFAAAGEADLFLETFEADGADHHLLADHVAWRAVHAHGFRELEVFIDRGFHLGARQILLEPRHVEAGILGSRQRTG